MGDSVLTTFVKEFGDTILADVSEALYKSPITNLLVLVGFTMAMIHLALGLRSGHVSQRSIYFIIAWLFCVPMGTDGSRKPFGYSLINGLGMSIVDVLMTAKDTIMKNGTTANLKEGYIMDSFLKAGQLNLDDNPALKEAVRVLVESCYVPGEKYNGKDILISDLLTKPITTKGMNDFYENRKAFYKGEDIRCNKHIATTQEALKEYLEAKTDPQNGTGKRSKVNSAVHDAGVMAMLSNSFSNMVDRSITQDMQVVSDSMSTPTKILFNLSQVGKMFKREIGMDKIQENVDAMNELNDRLISLPYVIASAQIFLKLLAPLALLSMLLGTFKLMSAWASMWMMSLMMTPLTQIMRGVSNSIIYYSANLENYASTMDATMFGSQKIVNVSIMTSDVARLSNVLFNVEMACWAALASMLLGASWFASGVASNIVSSMSSTMSSHAQRRIASSIGNSVSSAANLAKSSVGPMGGGSAVASVAGGGSAGAGGGAAGAAVGGAAVAGKAALAATGVGAAVVVAGGALSLASSTSRSKPSSSAGKTS